eukprot:Gregarina_sp_Poly_1__2977@NODE_1835_length_3250_cov_113_160540_g1192_i0_p2_GENE_NODE_1835_length_3250_cov_113_160540_g1192_i0NODE_1835_length_3250_cov_113_160540_g1192_i0_p2_ORF_typecomplete_len230_score41_27Mer2/PF09074_10/0_015BshC/PF10079_9/0_16_NODE_1835_length_3250_cov_113_160540_g1192_i024213110
MRFSLVLFCVIFVCWSPCEAASNSKKNEGSLQGAAGLEQTSRSGKQVSGFKRRASKVGKQLKKQASKTSRELKKQGRRLKKQMGKAGKKAVDAAIEAKDKAFMMGMSKKGRQQVKQRSVTQGPVTQDVRRTGASEMEVAEQSPPQEITILPAKAGEALEPVVTPEDLETVVTTESISAAQPVLISSAEQSETEQPTTAPNTFCQCGPGSTVKKNSRNLGMQATSAHAGG